MEIYNLINQKSLSQILCDSKNNVCSSVRSQNPCHFARKLPAPGFLFMYLSSSFTCKFLSKRAQGQSLHPHRAQHAMPSHILRRADLSQRNTHLLLTTTGRSQATEQSVVWDFWFVGSHEASQAVRELNWTWKSTASFLT